MSCKKVEHFHQGYNRGYNRRYNDWYDLGRRYNDPEVIIYQQPLSTQALAPVQPTNSMSGMTSMNMFLLFIGFLIVISFILLAKK